MFTNWTLLYRLGPHMSYVSSSWLKNISSGAGGVLRGVDGRWLESGQQGSGIAGHGLHGSVVNVEGCRGPPEVPRELCFPQKKNTEVTNQSIGASYSQLFWVDGGWLASNINMFRLCWVWRWPRWPREDCWRGIHKACKWDFSPGYNQWYYVAGIGGICDISYRI